ncbi:MAG: hypothetical protein DRP84_10165 [Spirochaetes bacterium]|nr:MAG: hypothetical protein DRP84_10165 [Spirochaetota bacterium]
MIKIPRTIVRFPFSSVRTGLKVILSKYILHGGYIKEFERAFAKYIGVKYAVSVSCGKMGLYLSLKALGAMEGDEIIVPSYTVWDVPAVIISLGLIPVFVDINSEDHNLDVTLIEKAVSSKTKFILATHIYGYPCDMASVLKIAQKYNLAVIEDCAQGLGAEYKGKKVGSIGDIGYFSFGILKNLNTLGGGMIVTNNAFFAEKVRREVESFSYPKRMYLVRSFLLSSFLSLFTSPVFFSAFVFPLIYIMGEYINKIISGVLSDSPPANITDSFSSKYKYKFTNLQAVIGLRQLKDLDNFNNRRIENAKILIDVLENAEEISIPKQLPQTQPVYLNYVIQVSENKREEIIKKMLKKGVDIGYGFLNSCGSMPEFQRFKKYCPLSDKLSRTNLYIPFHPPLEKRHVEYIANNLIETLDKL